MTDAAFCRTDIDLTGLGIDRNPPFEPYFCTPEGAAWRVLSLYRCGMGFVLDLAKHVPAEDVRRFTTTSARRLWSMEILSTVRAAASFDNAAEAGDYDASINQ